MEQTTKTMIISFIVNTILAITKVISGIIGKSSALIADGIHSFSDLITDIVAIIGSKIANKPADEKHPFGHGRSEYIASLLIGIMILLLGLGIIEQSVNNEITIPSTLVITVTIITIIMKFILSGYIIKKGRQLKNNILIASGYESSTDVISSIVVLISSILMQFTEQISILKYADKIATFIVGLFIIRVGFNILKENISIIVGEQETNKEYVKDLINLIKYDPNVIKIDSLHVLKYGPYNKLIGEVSMDGTLTLERAHQNLEELEKRIKEHDHKMKYITIHINPTNEKKTHKNVDNKKQKWYYWYINRWRRLVIKGHSKES